MSLPDLTPEELDRYAWQMWCPGVGEAGQRKLKAATVLVSRCGGVGGALAQQLAAAGVGRLIIAHAGELRLNDLNRQVVMSHAGIGTPRSEMIRNRLRDLNPFIEVETVAENISAENVDALVKRADIVASCAPLFEERFAMNAACVRHRRAMVDAAMYDFDLQLTTIVPGKSPCLRCLFREAPPTWKRQFPVFGAVAATVGSMGAAEIIKLITGIGEPLTGRLLVGDLRRMDFRTLNTARDPDCPDCSST